MLIAAEALCQPLPLAQGTSGYRRKGRLAYIRRRKVIGGRPRGFQHPATAARLSAMYGFRGFGALPAASIQPMYAPAAGLGQPIYQAAAGMGEYFESGVEGLGNYTGNPEIMQAAAGFGQVPEIDGPHIDPSSDLDRELSIAEAAAGVGEYFESGVQGLGEFYGPKGTIGRSSTWIPGQSDPSIWAGVRPVSRPQEATAMTTAGVLQSGGGAGILG